MARLLSGLVYAALVLVSACSVGASPSDPTSSTTMTTAPTSTTGVPPVPVPKPSISGQTDDPCSIPGVACSPSPSPTDDCPVPVPVDGDCPLPTTQPPPSSEPR